MVGWWLVRGCQVARSGRRPDLERVPFEGDEDDPCQTGRPWQGHRDWQGEDDPAFIGLMDSFADDAHPAVARLRELVNQRGWTGWTQVEKREP